MKKKVKDCTCEDFKDCEDCPLYKKICDNIAVEYEQDSLPF